MLSDPVDVIVCKLKSLLISEYSEDKDRKNLKIGVFLSLFKIKKAIIKN